MRSHISGFIRLDFRLAVAMYAVLNFLHDLGTHLVKRWVYLQELIGLVAAAVCLAVQPTYWTRPIRNVFARQLYFTLFKGLAAAVRVGFAAGVIIVVQAQLWGGMVGGGTDLLESVMLQMSLRELAPFLANLIVIGRSGTAMATEIAQMSQLGEIELLDAQGVDPMKYLAVPRILCIGISTFCLALIIIWTMMGVGYLVGDLLDVASGGPANFFLNLIDKITIQDVLFFLPKTLLMGLVVGAICCIEGFKVQNAATEVPAVASRSSVLSLTAVLYLAATLSLVGYGKLLFLDVFEILS